MAESLGFDRLLTINPDRAYSSHISNGENVMSKVTLTATDFGSNEIRVNGRHVSFPNRITSIEKTGPGIIGQANGSEFRIDGGKELGGAANEWYLEWPALTGSGYIKATSIIDAINIIEKA